MYAGDAVSRGPITVASVSTIAQACDRLRPSSRIFATIARSNDSWRGENGERCDAENGGSDKSTKHGTVGSAGRVDDGASWMLSVNGVHPSTRPLPMSYADFVAFRRSLPRTPRLTRQTVRARGIDFAVFSSPPVGDADRRSSA